VKKFQWKLEKVLTVRKQQEEVVRAELFEITKQAFLVRQNIMLLQTQIKSSAESVSENTDFICRKFFADFVIQTNKKIKSFENKHKEIENLRKQKLQQAVQARKKRKSLEILKEKALAEYNEWMNKTEQNELDDITNTAAARKLMYSY
jgi:flagellar export protein FliJ